MAKFEFPKQINFDSQVWHLVHSPQSSETVMPNLTGFHMVDLDCQPVNVPGRETPIFITIIDLVSPAHTNSSGEAVSERRMKGFRTYSEPPLNPGSVPPEECAFYMTVPKNNDRSTAQRFFNAIIGQTIEKKQMQKKADYSWCNELSKIGEEANESAIIGENEGECPANNGE